jgi:lipoate-protein ligase A
MVETWRIVDTGLRSAAQNIALDRALLEARRADEIPGTLRFLRFAPCVLIGCDRSPAQELNLEACRAGGIGVQRRLTAGDVMVLDERQLAWGLYLHRRDIGAADVRAITRRLCHAAAAALCAFGLDARCRAHNEIEVDGRRLFDGAGVFDGEAFLFQGVLSIDPVPGALARISRLVGAAPGAAGERVTGLVELLGARPDIPTVRRRLVEAFESEFGVELGEGELSLSEHARYRAALGEIDHPDWINLMSRPAAELPVLRARRRVVGGRLEAAVAYDLHARTVRQAWLASDACIVPRRLLPDLESALREVPAVRLAARIERFFAEKSTATLPFGPADVIELLQLAIGRPLPTGIGERDAS